MDCAQARLPIPGCRGGRVVIGNRGRIRAYTIRETGVITDLDEGCTIGSSSGAGPFSFAGAARGVFIGENVLIRDPVSVHSESHRLDDGGWRIGEHGAIRSG